MNAQVNQVEAITEVKYMSVDACLNLMADVFVQGMNHALGTDPALQPLRATLQAALNESTSVEFMTMDDAISEMVFEQNQVMSWDDLFDLETVSVDRADLMQLWLSGWQFGRQNQIFHEQMTTQPTAYMAAQEQAASEADDWDDDDAQAYILEQVNRRFQDQTTMMN